METIAKIRRMYHAQGGTIKGISRALKISKNTVRKVIRNNQTEFTYERKRQPRRALGGYIGILDGWLGADSKEPKRRQRTAMKLCEGLKEHGYTGSYDAVHEYVRKWRRDALQPHACAYIPLTFEAGDAFQFDWSEEEIKLGGVLTRVKVAQIRLCYSRLTFVIIYPNEQLEMVLDAHVRAFAFFGGVCQRGIYDNMKTVVRQIYKGKEREFNRRFLQMCSHYCFEPVACTPAAGWEKGQIEKQVGTSRQNLFTPLRHAQSLEELNKTLEDECLAWAKTHAHPEQKDKTIWQVYQQERCLLTPYVRPFESYRAEFTTVNACSLVRYATNSYSVECRYSRELVEMRVFVDKLVIVRQGKSIGEHPRHFGRHQIIYNPWHYLAALERKPGALRNGAPFKKWDLPSALGKTRQTLALYKDGDQQFVAILAAVQTYGLEAVERACATTLEGGHCNKTTVFQALKPKEDTVSAVDPGRPQRLLKDPPSSDCRRYNIRLSMTLTQGGPYDVA